MEVESCVFFKCADCPRVFEKRMHYNRHRKTHERPYPCPLCSKSFGLKTDRERHKTTHGRLVFKCAFPKCTFIGTNRKDYLWKHMQKKHQLGGDEVTEKKVRAYYKEAIREVKLTDETQRDFAVLEAARKGDDAKIRALLFPDSNAPRTISMGETFSGKRTLLHEAAESGYESLSRILIDNGASIDAEARFGETPFFAAIKAGHENIVKLLLQNGEDIHALSRKTWGDSALFLAVSYGHKAVVSLLLDKGAINPSTAKTTDALAAAVQTNQEDWVVLLLQKGVDPNCRRYNTPALHAAASVSPAMTRLIVDANADLEGKSSGGMTALEYAFVPPSQFAYRPNPNIDETIRILIDAGATISPTAWGRFSPELRKDFAHLSPIPPRRSP